MSGSDTDGAIGVSARMLGPPRRGVDPRDRALRPGVAQRPGDGPPRVRYSTGMPAGSRLPAWSSCARLSASFPGRARRAAPRRVRRRSRCSRSTSPATRRPHRSRHCSRAVRARCTTRLGNAARRSRSATPRARGCASVSAIHSSSVIAPPEHPASRHCAAKQSKRFAVLAARAPRGQRPGVVAGETQR